MHEKQGRDESRPDISLLVGKWNEAGAAPQPVTFFVRPKKVTKEMPPPLNVRLGMLCTRSLIGG